MKDKLHELIDNSDLGGLQKNIHKGFVIRAIEKEDNERKDRELIEKHAIISNGKGFEVVVSAPDFKIYCIHGKDEWDVKYPYRSIYLDEKQNWNRSNTVSPTLDVAILVYLGHKYLGDNNQFADFAIRMLEIKTND